MIHIISSCPSRWGGSLLVGVAYGHVDIHCIIPYAFGLFEILQNTCKPSSPRSL